MTSLTTIAFDADDTLWHNERKFRLTQDRFAALLADYAEPDRLHERLLAAERRNIRHYGYGSKSFTLSMIETAIEVSQAKAPASLISEILAAGRDLHAHPVECFEGVEPVLKALNGDYRLIVITKGDLFDQERKLASSGLDHLFDAVEIVTEKTAATYRTLFARHGHGTDRAMMVGNSLKSDILPALAAGAWAAHIPHEITWALEEADEPAGQSRFRRLRRIAELPAAIATLETG